MKVLYLYTEAMGYTMATIAALVAEGCEVHLVHEDKKGLTPYRILNAPGVFLYPNSAFTVSDLYRLAKDIDPDLTVVSGWVNLNYLGVAKRLRSCGKIVVTGLDNPWRGTLRQKFAVLASRFGYLSRFFSNVWVPGNQQYEFARHLGFDRKQIIFDMYSADLDVFQNEYLANAKLKQVSYPHRFLYVGRFAEAKGLDTLLSAWRRLSDGRGDWELHLIGNGPLRASLSQEPGVVFKDFMQPNDLRREVGYAGCFVLPSKHEPWGVVVHEFCASGLPLILSDQVGSASEFLIPGYNGFQFSAGNERSLAVAMSTIISLSDTILLEMGTRSHGLSNRITPRTSAANLLKLSPRLTRSV